MNKALFLMFLPILLFGQTPQAELCDSIFVSFVEYNQENGYIEIAVSTQFTSQYWYGYAGFTLTNQQGDVLAAENLETAGNVYGLGSNMYETRILETTENFISPFGQINLITGFFSGGSPEISCSWPLYDSSLYTYVPDDKFEQRLIEPSFDGKLYNLLGQEVFKREGVYIENGHVNVRFQ